MTPGSEIVRADEYGMGDERTGIGSGVKLDTAACVSLRDLYARPELHEVLDQAVRSGILLIADRQDDPEQAHWYLKGEEGLPDLVNPRFSHDDYINALTLLRSSPSAEESPLDILVAVNDTNNIGARIEALGQNATAKDYAELFAQGIIGCIPFRIDPSGRFAAEEILAAIDDRTEAILREELVTMCRERGAVLMSEVVDKNAMNPSEQGKWKREHGTPLNDEIASMAAAGYYIPNCFVIQGGEPYSRVVMPAFNFRGLPTGEVPTMTKEQVAQALQWYGGNTLSLENPGEDLGIAITIEHLPDTVTFVLAGAPRYCSLAVRDTGAANDEMKPKEALRAVKESIGEEEWRRHQCKW